MKDSLKYEREQVIGHGPECVVYGGKNRDLEIPVAVKELPITLRRSVARCERYYAEAALAARLRHDAIVEVIDVDRSSGWLVMPRLVGSLVEQLAAGPSPCDRVERILRQTLVGLQFLHQQGYLHGNLKPTNVLLTGPVDDCHAAAKLADARYVRLEEAAELPIPRGSHKYMAPELLDESFGAVGAAADIYALGLLTIELLIGPGFDGLFRGVVQDVTDAEKGWIRWHTSRDEAPLAVDQLIAGVPPRLAAVLSRMVAKDRLERYGSVEEVLEDLNRGEVSGPDAHAVVDLAERRAADQESSAPPSMPEPARRPAPARPPQNSKPAARRPALKIDAVPAWPASPIVFRHASGARAGQFHGLSASELTIGSGLTCDISFVEEGRPLLDEVAATIRRDVSGWVLVPRGSQPLLVNQQVVQDATTLRSGDMLRLTPEGPDLQFLIQVQNQKTLIDLLRTHAPRAYAVAQSKRPRKPTPAAPVPVGSDSSDGKSGTSDGGVGQQTQKRRGTTTPVEQRTAAPAAPQAPAALSRPSAGLDVAQRLRQMRWPARRSVASLAAVVAAAATIFLLYR